MENKTRTELQEVLYLCRKSFISVGFFSLFINLLMLVPAFYMLQVYDRVVSSGNLTTLAVLTLLVVFLLGAMGSLEWVRSRILVRVSSRLNLLLADRLYDLSFRRALLSGGAGNPTQPLQDLNGLRQYVSGNGLFAFFDAPWLPIYLVIMFLFHPVLGILGCVAAVVLIIIAVANEKSTSPPLGEANGHSMAANNSTAKNLRNAEVIEAMGLLPSLRKRWEERNAKMLYFQGVASDRGGVFTSVSKVFRLTVQSLALGTGALLAVQQEISPGTMIAGAILLGRALSPVDQMIGAWKGFVSSRGQYERLNELLTRIPEREDRMSLPAPKGVLKGEAATIIPPGSRTPSVMGASFEIMPGELIGIIGPSAAGKSSLVRGLLGIWPTASGALRIDEAECTSYNREELGPYIGYLPQDIELFDGTVSENIARFEDIDADAVVQAARDAGCHELILHLSQGYDTPIGQGGSVLSGGQRQRIGLARALYRRPPIVVLDEPNSNLDEHGEHALSEALQILRGNGSTVLIITHRTSILSRVDKLLLMSEGRIVEFDERDKVLSGLKAQRAKKLALAADPGAANPGTTASQG
ncbi:MAG: ATP-binding cassette subfamily C protein EexD [Halieaceae bacterium]